MSETGNPITEQNQPVSETPEQRITRLAAAIKDVHESGHPFNWRAMAMAVMASDAAAALRPKPPRRSKARMEELKRLLPWCRP